MAFLLQNLLLFLLEDVGFVCGALIALLHHCLCLRNEGDSSEELELIVLLVRRNLLLGRKRGRVDDDLAQTDSLGLKLRSLDETCWLVWRVALDEANGLLVDVSDGGIQKDGLQDRLRGGNRNLPELGIEKEPFFLWLVVFEGVWKL